MVVDALRGMALSHPDRCLIAWDDNAVGEALRTRRGRGGGDCCGPRSVGLAIEPPIGVVREEDDRPVEQIRATTVFVNTAANPAAATSPD